MAENGRLGAVTGALLDPLGLWATPDPRVARLLYRLHAPTYELLTALAAPWRERAVAALDLDSGDRVLDVGCGSGLNLPHLRGRVGASGHVWGVDLCPEMLARARRRAARAGWENVTLVEGCAAAAGLPAGVDAVLICAVHDVMRSQRTLARLAGLLRPGGRLVAAGCRWVPWLSPQGAALNLAMWTVNRPFVTTFEGFDRPWSHLAGLVEDLEVEVVAGGCGYIAHGTAPARPRRRRPAAQRRGTVKL